MYSNYERKQKGSTSKHNRDSFNYDNSYDNDSDYNDINHHSQSTNSNRNNRDSRNQRSNNNSPHHHHQVQDYHRRKNSKSMYNYNENPGYNHGYSQNSQHNNQHPPGYPDNNANPATYRRTQSWLMYKFMRIRCGACIILSTLIIFPLILLLSPDLFNEILNGKLIHTLIPKEFLGNSDITLDENIAPSGQAGRAPGVKQNVSLLLQKDDFDHEVLIYNRAPKCASIWLTRLLYLLGAGNMNEFTVQSPWEEGEKPFLTADGQRVVVKAIEATKKPLVYIRHQYFIDFEEFNFKRPLYLNMIRDPMKRFESFYYFIRFGNKEGDGADVAMSDARKYMTIDECVRAHDRECLEPKWQLVPYFCGHDPRCRQRSSWAVEKAKHNVEKYFAFVGIVEDLEGSLEVLEELLPRYFKNARNIKHDETQIKNDTYTLNKAKTSDQTISFLKTQTSIALEYDLYNFVFRRYMDNRKKLLLGSSKTLVKK